MLNTSTRRPPRPGAVRFLPPLRRGGASSPRLSAAARAQQRARHVALAILFLALAATAALTAGRNPVSPANTAGSAAAAPVAP